MGADEKPGLVAPSGDSFTPEVVVARLNLLCSSTRLSLAVPGHTKQGLVSEFDIIPADSEQDLCATPARHSDYRFYDWCCFPVEVSSVATPSRAASSVS